jgi:hypothetical protein
MPRERRRPTCRIRRGRWGTRKIRSESSLPEADREIGVPGKSGHGMPGPHEEGVPEHESGGRVTDPPQREVECEEHRAAAAGACATKSKVKDRTLEKLKGAAAGWRVHREFECVFSLVVYPFFQQHLYCSSGFLSDCSTYL